MLTVETSVTNLDETINLPTDFVLHQKYPNPFNPTTTINYQINKNDFVSLKVYDILGNEVATLVNEEKPTGSYEINFNASSLSSGTNFYKLQAGSFIETKKMFIKIVPDIFSVLNLKVVGNQYEKNNNLYSLYNCDSFTSTSECTMGTKYCWSIHCC